MTTKPLLSYGATNSTVIELQHRLNAALSSGSTALVPDGIFGPKTLAAVKEFQLQGVPVLVADGIVGPLTWGKLLVATLGDIGAVASQIRAAAACAPSPVRFLVGFAMTGLDNRRGRT